MVPRLRVATPAAWLETVLADFDSFLRDHAACERKASGTALKLASHYPDRPELVAAMIDLAREELEHFHQAYQQMVERGLTLAPDARDPYVRRLSLERRDGSARYFLDRLLISGIVEARGCERFAMVAAALPPGRLKDFYRDIARSEARHQGLFVRLATLYFEPGEVRARLDELLEAEAKIVVELSFRATLF